MSDDFSIRDRGGLHRVPFIKLVRLLAEHGVGLRAGTDGVLEAHPINDQPIAEGDDQDEPT